MSKTDSMTERAPAVRRTVKLLVRNEVAHDCDCKRRAA